jgi:hypothetical protein
VAVLLTGGGIQGCGAGPGGEAVAVGEPGDVADVGQDAGSHDRADAVDVHQTGAAGEHDRLQLGGRLLDLGLDRDQLGQLLGGDATASLPSDVPRSDGGQHGLGLAGGEVTFRLPWQEFSQQCLESVDGLDPAPGECFAAVGEHPQRLELAVELQYPQGLVRSATIAIA